MRFLPIVPLFLLTLLIARAQMMSQTEPASTTEGLAFLSKLAHEAHAKGDVEQEIEYRQRFSQEAWANFALHPKDPGRFNRFSIVFFNDLPLGLLLEGTHQWPESEAIFRHNQSELAQERLAGNDIKSENELDLAHLLSLEGKQAEAKNICEHWKKRVSHNADSALYAENHNVPAPPLYDTPEVEIAGWDLACGRPEEGLNLLKDQMAAHPRMLISFTVLSHYYFATGDFKNGLKTEIDGTSALLGRLHP